MQRRSKSKTTPKKQMVLHVAAPSLSFPTDCSLVLCSAGVLDTNGSMRRYLLPNQVAQGVQLHLNGISIQVACRRYQKREVEKLEPYKWPPAGYWCVCFWPNCTTAPSSSIGICEWTPLIGSVLSTDESRFTLSACDRCERVRRRRGECYAACDIIKCDWFGSGSVTCRVTQTSMS